MRYETLKKTEKTNILLQRLQQFEQDHYNHGLNIALLESAVKAGDDSEQTEQEIKRGKAAQQTIEKAVAHIKGELASLGHKDIQKLLSPPTDTPAPMNRATKRAAARKAKSGKAKLKTVENEETADE